MLAIISRRQTQRASPGSKTIVMVLEKNPQEMESDTNKEVQGWMLSTKGDT